jgi:hypothetical protein
MQQQLRPGLQATVGCADMVSCWQRCGVVLAGRMSAGNGWLCVLMTAMLLLRRVPQYAGIFSVLISVVLTCTCMHVLHGLALAGRGAAL